MADEKKQSGMFAAIRSRDDANRVAKHCGNVFFFVSAILGGLGVFLAPSLLVEAAVYALCGYFVRFRKSRAAAVIILLYAGIIVVTTFMNTMDRNSVGGKNIVMAVIVVVAAVRAVEATFKSNALLKSEPSFTKQADIASRSADNKAGREYNFAGASPEGNAIAKWLGIFMLAIVGIFLVSSLFYS